MDDPRADHLKDAPIASPADWVLMKSKLLEDLDDWGAYRYLGTDARLDFFVSTGYWYAATFSITGEDTGAFKAVVGWFRGSQFSCRETKKDLHLNKKTLAKYERLKAADSLWLLIDDSEFWTDTVELERVYWKSGPKANPYWGVKVVRIRELEDEKTKRGRIPSSYSGWMAYMAAIASHVFDSNMIEPSSGRVPTKSVDYVAH